MSLEINVTDQIVEINETSTPVEINAIAGAAIPPVWGAITGTLSNQTDLQLVLDGKVPYTGAIANVNLGTYNLTASSLRVNTSGQTTTITNFYPPTTDGRNIFIGGGGLNSVRIGRADDASENTAVGVNALFSNTSGRDNTAIGHNSMYFTTTGQFNVAVGDSSLIQNTSGVRNSVLGQSALNINTTGNSNIAIGNLAGSGGFGNTTGSNNIFIGASAVGESATESNRTFIGNNSTTSSWLGGKLLLGSRVDASSDILQATGTASVTSNMLVGQLTLNTTPSGTAVVGTTRWNDTIGSSETTLKGGSVLLKNGVDLVARVVNKVSPNTTLTKAAYQAVRVSGAQGQRLAIELAQANNDNNSADTIGLVTETIAPNQEGFIITVGQLENINTTGSLQGETWVDGDVLYLSPTTAGRLTNVKPVAPNHIIVIGYVEYAHANNGKIYVKVMNGWELGELHDVETTGATNGQVLKYNGTIWTPSGDVGITSLNGLNATTQTFATGTSGTDFNISSATSTHTFNLPTASGTNRGLLSSTDWTTFNNKQNALTNPITGTGAAGQVAYFTGATTQAGSNNLFWDNTNGRLGIGTNAPAYLLDVNGGARINNSTQFIFDTSRLQISTAGVSGFYGNNFINWASSTTFTLQRQSGTVGIRISAGDNVLINSTTDSGQRLQVTGDTLLRGSGNTSATTALTVQNSDGTTFFRVRNDGQVVAVNGITTGSTGSFSGLFPNGGSTSFEGLLLRGGLLPSVAGTDILLDNVQGTPAITSGTRIFLEINRGFNPTSGTGVYNMFRIAGTINQTGGANGITRGLFVNPTLTAAADWRSIEWSNNTGWGLSGVGTAPNFLAGSLGIGTAVGLTDTALRVAKNMTGGTTYSAIYNDGTIQTDVTTSAIYFRTQARTAASVAITNVVHYYAQSLSLGAGATVTNQFGYHAENNLIGATNNFGFYGNIAASTGRWNLYMNGTADNYMAGNLLIGTTTVGMKLTVVDTGVTYVAQFRGGSSSYITVGDTSLGGESGVNLRNSSGQGFLGLSGQVLGLSATSGANTINLSTGGTVGAQLTTNRNLILQNGGTFTDSGERLQVTGNARITGATVIETSLGFGTDSSRVTIFPSGTNSRGITIKDNAAGTASYPTVTIGDQTKTSTGKPDLLLNSSFSTSNINFGFNKLELTGTYTEVSGGTATRGLYINTTIGATNNYRAIEWTNNNGWGLYGSGASLNYLGGNTSIGTTANTGDWLNIGASTTAKAQIFLAAGTAPTSPNDGDIWFDGTNLRMRIGGVTRTFTLT